MNATFPLREGFFRPLVCSREDARRHKQRMTALLEQSLEEELPYWTSHYTYIDAKRWKPLKEKDRIRTYQARRSLFTRGRGATSAHAVLAIGTIDGSLEEVVYGMRHVATADMRATMDFLRDNSIDGAVLHVFENGVPEDPFRSLAVKWRVVETPGGSFVSNRDGCVLEYMGIGRDANGQRYGFHIAEDFQHPVCPPFNARCAVRSSVHTRMVFREISPGRIGMYFKGDYGLGGRLPGSLARRTAADMALGIARTVACSEAKKLTALTLAVSPIFHEAPASFLPDVGSVCSICSTKPGYLSTKSMTWCKVCGSPVCSKCKSRKYILSDDKKIRISCCKQCIVAAKRFPVDPTQPMPLISAGQWLSLILNQTRSLVESGLDRSYASSSSSDPRSQTEISVFSLSTSRSATSMSTRSFDNMSTRSFDSMSIRSMDDLSNRSLNITLDNLLTPVSSSTKSEEPRAYEEPVALLECSDMASLMEEDEDELPTLGDIVGDRKASIDVEIPFNRKISLEDDFKFNRKVSLEDDLLFKRKASLDEDDDDIPLFARSAFTPSVAKNDDHWRIHHETGRMSLFSRMQRIRDQAENAFSMTQANGWEYMGGKGSTSSWSSSMRSTAVMSTSSHGSMRPSSLD